MGAATVTTWTLAGEPFEILQVGAPATTPGPAELAATSATPVEPSQVVLVLHGFPDHPPSFLPLAHALADAGYHVVMPWMRGYAPSTCRGPVGLEQLRDDALAILERASPGRPATLLGHDWGALTTYAVCAAAPHRVRRAIAMSVPTPRAFLRQLASSRQLLRSWYIGLFQLGLADRVGRGSEFALIDWLWRRWSPQLRHDAAAVAALHACLRASWPAPLAPYRALFTPRLLRPRLAELRRWRLTVPTLQLHGQRDGCIAPVARARQRADFAAAFEQRVLPAVGHFLHVEAPAEVAREILAWLAAEAAAPGAPAARSAQRAGASLSMK